MKTVLIVGLGNPGEKYEFTRHNLGFTVIDKFFRDSESLENYVWNDEKKLKSQIARITWQPKSGEGVKAILIKPKTFMNNSGMAVSLVSEFYKVPPENIWIIYDELDLPLGSMKIRIGGAAAGHKGVESIIESLGTDKFWRFRLGIGESKNHEEVAKQRMHNVDDFVLGNFTEHEAGKHRELIKRAAKSLKVALEDGIQKAMNQFNTK